MTNAHEAAAFWGSADNVAYPVTQRLQMALAALEFFGGEYEKQEEASETGVIKVELGDTIEVPGGLRFILVGVQQELNVSAKAIFKQPSELFLEEKNG